MSPEQAWGKHVDKRSDVFALATVLFEMLTARKLFTGENELSVLEQVREARVTAPSLYNDEVSPEIDAIVVKALQKEPEKRYQTAGEMARDLDQVLYSFKPTPTSADLAIYMHRLAEPAQPQHMMEPEPIPVPPPAPVKAAPVAPAPIAAPAPMPAWEATPSAAAAEPPAKKLPIVPIIIVAVLLIGAAAFFMMKRGSSTPATKTAATAGKPIAAPPPATTTAVTTSAPLTASAPSTTSGTTTALDQARVDEEVRKRLDAERLKLEQQQAKTAATATQPAAPAPRPVTPAPQQVAQAPAPVSAAPAPVPPPVAAPQPVAESRPAPQPAAPETPRTREGDLVPAGTEGLTPARITRLTPPVYPIIARQQRVEGSVLVNALISETGQVLDAKVLVGVNRPVGINEAALQTVRRSTFSPGQKDGVRVKSWTTVKVDFKL
jgi:TonB family protein